MLQDSSFQSGNVLSETEVSSDERPSAVEPIMSYRNCSHNKLLPLMKTPKHLQFNPFVLEGYRPQMNAWDCLISLTYLHNETINILSHGLPLLYAIWNLPSLLPWEDISFPILPYFHAAATVSPWLGSSIYHLFMNHFSGEDTYERLLQWDVVGVWVTQSCGGFTTVFVGIVCLPWPIRLLILGIYLLFALKSLHAAVFAVGPWERRSSFAAMFIMRIGVILLRLSPYGGGHPEAVF